MEDGIDLSEERELQPRAAVDRHSAVGTPAQRATRLGVRPSFEIVVEVVVPNGAFMES